jgi:hypothetical protein
MSIKKNPSRKMNVYGLEEKITKILKWRISLPNFATFSKKKSLGILSEN